MIIKIPKLQHRSIVAVLLDILYAKLFCAEKRVQWRVLWAINAAEDIGFCNLPGDRLWCHTEVEVASDPCSLSSKRTVGGYVSGRWHSTAEHTQEIFTSTTAGLLESKQKIRLHWYHKFDSPWRMQVPPAWYHHQRMRFSTHEGPSPTMDVFVHIHCGVHNLTATLAGNQQYLTKTSLDERSNGGMFTFGRCWHTCAPP